MSIYDDMRVIATDVLNEFKQGTVRYVQIAPAAGGTPDDPGQPVETYHTVTAVVRPVSTKYVDGSHIVQSDRQMVMPNKGVTPTMAGFVDIDDDRFKIVEIMPRPSAGVPIVFVLIVRR